MRRRRTTLLGLALIVAACGTETEPAKAPAAPPVSGAEDAARHLPFPESPTTPTGPFSDEVTAALDSIWSDLAAVPDPDDLAMLGDLGDARVAWLFADLLRFFGGSNEVGDAIRRALFELTGIEFTTMVTWVPVTDHLMAWDTPVPPEYADYKRRLFTLVDERWGFVFSEPNDLDERRLTWGGVLIDDRPLGDPQSCPRGCIPALDDPRVTGVSGGEWYPNEGTVFGVVVDGMARAYPKHIMETHEMVNDTLGGRRVGIPYCTLCGAAQAFLLDDVEGFDNVVLRTTGLLSRSNKVMYDLESQSVFDTFTGRAVAGPMFEAGVRLSPVAVVTSTWGSWKATHPETTIVAEDGGIGRRYDLDPLNGRDDEGPIFPIGDRDLRLAAQEQILGVVLADGTTVAFPVRQAAAVLADGGTVHLGRVTVALEGDGLIAAIDGTPAASHQAFWFAWSQFHPDTELWSP